MPSAPSFLDKKILKKNPNNLVMIENIVTIATALNIDFITCPKILYLKKEIFMIDSLFNNLGIYINMNIELCDKFFYRVQQSDTLFSLCERFNTCIENIERNNKDIDLYPGEVVFIKMNEFKVHIVKPTETLKNIAEKYGKSEQDIVLANNLSDNKLFIGQRLKIN